MTSLYIETLSASICRFSSFPAGQAKFFLKFVTLIVRNRIYNLLKEEMLRIETKPNYLTVPAAIRELEKIEMVRRNNGNYRLDHAVTKKPKNILAVFGLDAEYRLAGILNSQHYLTDGITKYTIK